MKKSLLVLTCVSIAALIAFFLSRAKEASDETIVAETDKVVGDVSPNASVVENLNIDSIDTEGVETLNPELPEQPSIAASRHKATLADTIPNIEEAMIQRELHRAEIAAEYSSSGDGTLTEADMRRYAEERYLKRRDINGNGKLDGFELRAIARNQSSQEASTDLNRNLSRER